MTCFSRLRLAVLGMLLLGCGREQGRDAATDTLPNVPPADSPAVDSPVTVRPADTASADTANPDTAANPAPEVSANVRPNRQPSDTPPSVQKPQPSPTPTPPPSKPNIDPRPADPMPRVPAPAAQQNQDTVAQPPPALRDQYHQAPKDTVSLAVYNGWKQYSLNCARCHGEDVLGTTIAPHLIQSLKPNGPINTKAAFLQVVCEGRPARGMPAWCPLGLDTTKIEQVYAYVKGRSEGQIGPGRPALRE